MCGFPEDAEQVFFLAMALVPVAVIGDSHLMQQVGRH